MKSSALLPRLIWTVVVAIALIIGGSGCQNVGMPDVSMYQEVGFDRVKPILQDRCLPCHQGTYMGAVIPDFRTSKELFEPNRQPRLIVPGDPEASRIMQVVYLTKKEGEGAMPPLGHGMTADEMNLLGEWIKQGACWPDGEVLQSAAVADMKKSL